VPVTVIRQDENSGTNQLEAARQTIRSLMAAKQEAERLLGEAQTAIRDLQTKLAHERLARDEAVSRAEADRQASAQTLQSVQAGLAVERGARRQAEQRLAEALEGRQEAGQRLRDVLAAQQARSPFEAPVRGRPRKTPSLAEDSAPPDPSLDPIVKVAANKASVAVSESPNKSSTAVKSEPSDTPQPVQHRRRGRPPKVEREEAEVVEWWVPGWKERLR